MRPIPLALALTLSTAPLAAQASEADAYVEANLLSIFYHELGHALIDVLELPIFGQEEDAADAASILLIDALFEEEVAQEIAVNAAFGFWDEAAASSGEETAWWDEHGPDLQRYYNLVCLFYGAEPEAREDLAEDLGLPEERAESCPEEFDLAIGSWGLAFEEIATDRASDSLRYEEGAETVTQNLISEEVAALNQDLSLPTEVTVRVETCDEANAFYDPNDKSIIMCAELEAHLRGLFTQN